LPTPDLPQEVVGPAGLQFALKPPGSPVRAEVNSSGTPGAQDSAAPQLHPVLRQVGLVQEDERRGPRFPALGKRRSPGAAGSLAGAGAKTGITASRLPPAPALGPGPRRQAGEHAPGGSTCSMTQVPCSSGRPRSPGGRIVGGQRCPVAKARNRCQAGVLPSARTYSPRPADHRRRRRLAERGPRPALPARRSSHPAGSWGPPIRVPCSSCRVCRRGRNWLIGSAAR